MITVVTGVPRSGTSMIMQMLEAGGLEPYADFYRKKDYDNPKGYYENEKFKEKCYDNWIDEADGLAVKIISFHLNKLPTDRDCKILFINRDLDEVFASANKMLERLGKEPLQDKIQDIWRRHIDDTVKWIKKSGIHSLIVGHGALIKDPADGAELIKRFLKLDLDTEAMASAVCTDLYRNRS